MLDVFFRETAARQARDAQDWYEAQRTGLGAEFAGNLEAVVSRLSRQPEGAPLVWQDVRRAHLKRFPWSVFYVVEPERLVVLRRLHNRRDPAAWPSAD